jgi:hypothetical protein
MAETSGAQPSGDSGAARPPSTGAQAQPQAAKPTASTAQAKAKPAAAARGASAGQAEGPIELIKADHRKVEALFDQYEKAQDGGQKAQLCRQICAELVIHTMIEEEIFYPECRRHAGQDEETEDKLDEAQVEHDSAKLLVGDLFDGGGADPLRDAKVQVLAEQIRHHIREEEKPGEGILAKAAEEGLDTPDLARRLQQRKQQLQAEQQAGRLRPPPPKTIKPPSRSQGRSFQEESMPQDRDQRGRFTSDDDRDYGRSYAERGGGRSRYQDDDERGGGYRSRDYEDDNRGRGSQRGGQGGWFGDPEGHSRASREGWDEHRGSYMRSQGERGWYGDPEGHSRASREGWDERRGESRSYGSRGRDDDDDRGYRSRGRDDDDDRRGGRSQGGWFGDPEGHSRASREGWDERRGDDRSYRARSRDDDDDRRGGRGHGGWFGDPEGHSRASREGWDRR